MTSQAPVRQPGVRHAKNAVRAADFTTTVLLPLGVLSGLAGLIASLAETPAVLRTALVLLMLLGAPGAPLVAASRLVHTRSVAVVASAALSVSIVALLTVVQLGLGFYRPNATAAVLALLTLLSAGTWLWLRRPVFRLPAARPRRPSPLGFASVGLALAAVALVVMAAGGARRAGYSDYGLLVREPVVLGAPLLALIGLVLATRARSGWGAVASLAALVIARRGLTLLATEVPVFPWTFKHLGVIDWFRHSGVLARDVDVYSNWPGALGFFAWFIDVSGLAPVSLAHAYLLAHHLILIGVVFALGRAFGLDRWACAWSAATIEIADWVGQDYLSPQAFSFLLAGAFLAMIVSQARKGVTRTALVLSLTVYAALVWSHQLAPAWLLLLILILAVTRQLRPWWIVALFALVYGSMLLANTEILARVGTDISFRIAENAGGNARAVPVQGQAFTGLVVRGVAVLVWGAVLVLGFLGWRREPRTAGWPMPLILTFSPFALLVAGYGGEAIYRVFLYSLLGACLVIGPWVAGCFTGRPLPDWRGSLLLLGILAGAVQGSYGPWFTNICDPVEMRLAIRLAEASGSSGRVVTPKPAIGFPTRLTWRYVDVERDTSLRKEAWSLANEAFDRRGVSERSVRFFAAGVQEKAAHRPVFVVVSGSAKIFAHHYGVAPEKDLDGVADLLLATGDWQTVYDDGRTRVIANEPGVVAYRMHPDVGDQKKWYSESKGWS